MPDDLQNLLARIQANRLAMQRLANECDVLARAADKLLQHLPPVPDAPVIAPRKEEEEEEEEEEEAEAPQTLNLEWKPTS